YVDVDAVVDADGRNEAQAHTELLEVEPDLAEASRHRDRILAANEKARGLARDGGEVGLGKDGDEPVLVERVDERVYRGGTVGARLVGAYEIVDGVSCGGAWDSNAGQEIGTEWAKTPARVSSLRDAEGDLSRLEQSVPIDAEGLRDVARHFGYADAQIDLIGRVYLHLVDELFRVADEALCDPPHVVAVGRRIDRAFQHQRAVE